MYIYSERLDDFGDSSWEYRGYKDDWTANWFIRSWYGEEGAPQISLIKEVMGFNDLIDSTRGGEQVG